MKKSLELDVLCGFVAILALVGTLGNIIVLLVYARRRDRRATNVFIRTLAALDLIVCVVVMPYTIVYEYQVVYSQFACKTFELTRHFNVSMSNLTLVAVAVERYVAICKPTFSVLAVHVHRGVMVMVFISILFSVPSLWVFAVISTQTTLNNTTTIENITATDSQVPFGNRSDLPEPKETYCRFTTSILGPLNTLIYQGFQMVVWFSCIIVIMIMYGLIYCAVWKRDRVRNSARVTPSVWLVRQSDEEQVQNTDSVTDSSKKRRLFLGKLPPNSGQNTEPKMVPIEQSEVSANSYTIDLGNNPREAPQILIQRKVERRINAHRKTGTMLFLCTVIYVVTWTPFFLDIFGVTNSLVFRHAFFISNASNPIIYGIVNKQVRVSMYSILRGKRFRT